MKKKKLPLEFLSYLLIIGFGAAILFAFIPNFTKLSKLDIQYSQLQKQLQLEEKKNISLKKEYNGLSNNPDYIEKVAREKLGWSRPNETVYRFTEE